MSEPAISVVIPVLDRRDLLDETLRCLRSQTCEAWECLVVDDGSTDGTLGTIARHAAEDARIRLVPKPSGRPRGPSASRNVGLEAARGRFVHFFDSDDLMADDLYAAALARMDGEGLDFFAVGIRWFLASDTASTRWDLTEGEPFVREEFVPRAVATRHRIWTQNVLWRRSLLAGLGSGYREDLSQVEDLEFAVRAMLSAGAFGFDDHPRVFVRRHASSLTLEASPARERERRMSNDEVYRLILGHLERAAQAPGYVVDYCLVERYRHLAAAARRGEFPRGLCARQLRLLADLATRRPRLAVRFALLAPLFWFRGAAARLGL